MWPAMYVIDEGQKVKLGLTLTRTLSVLRLTSGVTVWDHVCMLVADTLNTRSEMNVRLYDSSELFYETVDVIWRIKRLFCSQYYLPWQNVLLTCLSTGTLSIYSNSVTRSSVVHWKGDFWCTIGPGELRTLRTQDTSDPGHFGTSLVSPNCPDRSALVPKCPKDSSDLCAELSCPKCRTVPSQVPKCLGPLLTTTVCIAWSKTPSVVTLHKSLAVAEMGDRLAIDMGWKVGAAVTLFGELGPHLTQCGLGWGLYLRSKWHLDPSSRLATIDMGQMQVDRLKYATFDLL